MKRLWLDFETTAGPSSGGARSASRGYGIVEAGVVLGEDTLTFQASARGMEKDYSFLGSSLSRRISSSTLTEKQLLEQLLPLMEGSSSIAGFNIKKYDLPFLRRRAKYHGLGLQFARALKGKEILDVADPLREVLGKQILASTHPSLERYKPAWKYYLGGDKGARPRGWSQELAYELFTGSPLKDAHQAGVDARASRRLLEVISSPNSLLSTGWEERFLAIRARLDRVPQKSFSLPKWWKVAGGVGLGVAGILQLEPLRFSGKDDAYNILEGLPHGGMASQLRKQNTDFGSGYQGLRVHGQVIAPEVQEFRDKYFSSPETEAALQQKLKDERRGSPGEFEEGDLFYPGGKVAQVRDLSQFSLKWEDADTLLLQYPWYKFWKRDISVRLAGIDAPEISHDTFFSREWWRFHQEQPHGQESKKYVESLDMEGARLEVAASPAARTYGRYLGLVYLKDQREPLNLQLVREGQAAALPWGEAGSDIYSRATLRREEKKAADLQKGIWGDLYYQKYLDISKGLGGRLTFNTLSDLSRLAKNYHLAAAQSWMENDEAPYTPFIGKYIGQKLRPSYGRFFRGTPRIGESFNPVEGMSEQGINAATRKKNTDFGSRVDPARAIARGIGISLERMTKTPGWQKALEGGKVLRKLGEGRQGRAWLMEQTFQLEGKAQPFYYVRKELIGGGSGPLMHEASFLRELGETASVPSYYHLSNKGLYQEFMEGVSAKDWKNWTSETSLSARLFARLKGERPIPELAQQQLLETAEVALKKGIFNPDIHSENVLINPKTGGAAWIDWGLAEKFDVLNAERAQHARMVMSRDFWGSLGFKLPNIGGALNPQEALPSSGLGHESRKSHGGQFCSKYDVIRDAFNMAKLALESGRIQGLSVNARKMSFMLQRALFQAKKTNKFADIRDVTFEQFTSSSLFQKALEEGSLIRNFTPGVTADVALKQGRVGGISFRYAHKKLKSNIEEIAESAIRQGDVRWESVKTVTAEARALEKLGETPLVPSLYGTRGEKELYMEAMSGVELDSLPRGKNYLTARMEEEISETSIAMSREGVVHEDLHSGNMLINQVTGSLAVLDFGMSQIRAASPNIGAAFEKKMEARFAIHHLRARSAIHGTTVEAQTAVEGLVAKVTPSPRLYPAIGDISTDPYARTGIQVPVESLDIQIGSNVHAATMMRHAEQLKRDQQALSQAARYGGSQHNQRVQPQNVIQRSVEATTGIWRKRR